LEFTETMKGFWSPGATDPDEGEKAGKAAKTRLSFRLTIHIEDVDRFIRFPEHEARATGYVDSDDLSDGVNGGRMEVTHGGFNLFVIPTRAQPTGPSAKRCAMRSASVLPTARRICWKEPSAWLTTPALIRGPIRPRCTCRCRA
jgi:hypothetical protein